jgi:hypothetical protein
MLGAITFLTAFFWTFDFQDESCIAHQIRWATFPDARAKEPCRSFSAFLLRRSFDASMSAQAISRPDEMTSLTREIGRTIVCFSSLRNPEPQPTSRF